MNMTLAERKQVQAETLLEITKGLTAVAPRAGMVSYAFTKLAEQFAKQADELIKEARRLASQ